ncbi:hypothetical protein B0J17DRAFT_632234 [Rhizoctonia solani]|nr:hypothetical protein B0J17DRAFT_632234 [Rhizoctonia solani]
MAEQFKSATDQLQVAWDNYFLAYSALRNHRSQEETPYTYGFPPEVSHHLDTQLAFISLYESKIQKIKLEISYHHNYSSGLSPINMLPPETLINIFHLVLAAQPCKIDRLYSSKKYFPRHSDYLATAISSHSLWCHIDLSIHEPWSYRLLNRAKVYVARAGQLPLELHITGGDFYCLIDTYCECQGFYGLISHISSRVETLDIVVTGEFEGSHSHIFSTLLLSQRPALVKFILRSISYHHDTFIVDRDSYLSGLEGEGRHLPLGLTEPQLTTSFAPIKALHLRGIFPLWSSTAYHGLSDLRLLSTKHWSHITEAQFVAVLKSSPGLQILHFGPRIHGLTTDTERVTPVNLPDLQVVKIFPTNNKKTLSPSSVLRLLAPGMKPLRLAFDGYYQSDSAVDLEKFFGRSRVIKFYVQTAFPPLSILQHAAHLECVVLDGFRPGPDHQLTPVMASIGGSTSFPYLRSLHIMETTLYEHDLRVLLEYCPTGILLQSCYIYFKEGTSGYRGNAKLHSHKFPGVRATDHPIYPPEAPIASWDRLE